MWLYRKNRRKVCSFSQNAGHRQQLNDPIYNRKKQKKVKFPKLYKKSEFFEIYLDIRKNLYYYKDGTLFSCTRGMEKKEDFMSVQLLDKTRKINKLLHNNNSTKVVFNDICKVLVETLDSNILVISRKGKVLGVSLCDGVEEITELIEDKVGGYIDTLLNDRFLSVLSTKENVNLETLGFVGPNVKKYYAIISPIDIAGERLGTLFMYRSEKDYDIDDIIVSEYGTTVVGLEMMRSVNEEQAEETRKVQVVKSAFNTLSFSEMEAIVHIFEELDGNEGILVASKVADRVGITRSVIVNALRKFESAGIIESRSSGMKGTYIKVLNDVIFDELARMKKEKE